MAGLKDHHPGVTGAHTGGYKVTPDEIDQDQQYVILNPDVTGNSLGTAAAGTVDVAWTRVGTYPDYPRNVLFSVTGPAGGAGGTTTVNGKDQFGGTIAETITIASANGGGTTAGTKVFGEFTSGTYFPNGADNTSTAVLGLAIATASNSPIFGLPAKLGGTADIKNVVWLDADVSKEPVSDAGAAAVVAQHAVRVEVSGGLAAADSFVVRYRSSYNSGGDAQIANS